jgi:tRNA pseudouridine55 synthase
VTGSVPTGFLLVDKQEGWTSHDVVAKIRGSIGGKVGHAGTLDPMATGLLVVGIGAATRLLRFVQVADKEYLATALFGVATDSLDADGAMLSREPLPVTAEEIDGAMNRFRGLIMQVPPMVSARKVEGRRLYELAREGKIVEREARQVTIHRLELVDLAPSDYPEVTFRTVCSTGTYIRTLADDLARAVGGRAHLTALRRIRIGSLNVTDAVSVDDVVTAAEEEAIDRVIIGSSEALSEMPEIRVDDNMARAVRNGRELANVLLPTGIDSESSIRIGDRDGELLAVYRHERNALRPEVVLP